MIKIRRDRYAVVLVSFMLVSSLLLAGVNMVRRVHASPLIFSDNFDDGDISDWTVTTSGAGVFDVSASKSASSPYSVHMHSLGSSRADGNSPTYTLDLTRDYNVSLHFLIPHTDNHWFEVFNNHQTYLVIDYGSALKYYTGATAVSIMTLTTNMWYFIEIKVHPSSNNYDVYVNGTFRKTCSMWIHGGWEDSFRIGDRASGSTDKGEAYWDDIYIHQEPELPSTSINVDPADLIVEACQNFTVNISVTDVLPPGCTTCEFKLYYNTTFMDGLSVELPPGHFLEPSIPSNLIIYHKEIIDSYNATHGRVWVSAELLSPPEVPRIDSGVLAEVTFHCTDGGETELKLDDTVLIGPGGVFDHTTNDGHVASEAPAVMGILPLETTVPISETFTANVSIYAVRDLYSWGFNMSFDPTRMECLSVEEGPFLQDEGTTQFVTPIINNETGTITGANCSLVAATDGVNGTGTLATIEFLCKSVGRSTLDLKDTLLYNSTSAEIFHTVSDGSINQVRTVTYRLLAVEKFYSNSTHQIAMKSAQYLIQNLTRFRNWQNGTWGNYNYRSYIHLLSNATVAPSLTQFFRGLPNRTNILDEITTFLNDTGPGESNDLTIRIFYYVGHTSKAGWGGSRRALDLRDGMGSDLEKRILDWELDQALTSGDLGNSNCTLVVLDTCYSGAYTKNLTRPGRVILTATWKRTARGWIRDIPSPGKWSWFTGHQNGTYYNGTSFGPLGIIGGLFNAKDRNGDGWRSAGEIFNFARETTKTYARTQPTSRTMIPTSSYGVAGGGIPLVMHHEYIKFYDFFTSRLVEAPIWFPHNAAPQTPSSATLPSEDWLMFGNLEKRASFSSANGSLAEDSVWNTSIGVPIASSAAIVEGMVYVGTLNSSELPCGVYALDVTTGAVIWSFLADGTIYSSPAVVNGSVFVGTLGGGGGGGACGTLYVLDAYTGLVRWNFTTPLGTGGIFASPAVADNIVFIATMGGGGGSGGCVCALNASSGEPIWNFTAAGPMKSSPAVSDNMVIVATMGGGAGGGAYVYGLDEATGEPVWPIPFETDGPVISSPAVANGRVFVATMGGGGGSGGSVYALNEFSGTPLWNNTASAPISSSPAIDFNRECVIVGSDDGVIYALRVTDGVSDWTRPIGPINMSSPAISSNGLIYIGSLDNRTYCLNGTTGDVVWICETEGPIVSSPALTDEHVIISSLSTESVYCIGPPFPVHDVAVSNAAVLPETVLCGESVNITYTVVNNGNVDETFQATCVYNNTRIWEAPLYKEPILLHTENITLQSGANTTKTYTWNTTGAPYGTCTLMVQVNLRSDIEICETILTNNIYIGGTVRIKIVGDVDDDGDVDASDLFNLSKAYGSTPIKPNWNATCDLNRDLKIDASDLFDLSKNYGKTNPHSEGTSMNAYSAWVFVSLLFAVNMRTPKFKKKKIASRLR